MPNTKTSVPFVGTTEQAAKLQAVIQRHKGQRGASMPVLQEAQEIYGYLPEEVQVMVAEGLDIPLTEIYGIVSFYSQFILEPKGKTHIAVCMGTACYVRGAGDILDDIANHTCCKSGGITDDGSVSIEATRCIGACGLAPVLTINNDVYGKLDRGQIEPIIDEYLEKAKAEEAAEQE
ncbi:MAG: NAD(P)H-dependent oxidoreductase subunit E [Oscillospiraceae bacterium]|nr:NAD(P)H-dependent oxidoreductase subunit E [Oscillospiraceae bacterium]